MFEKLLPYDVAHTILSAYINYHRQYKRITKRAQIRFEVRDWQGSQSDSRERVLLYRDTVGRTTEEVKEMLGDRASLRHIWKEIKHLYFEEIVNFNTRNIAETFYNSVFRHAHKGLSADEELMFVHATGTYREFKSTIPIFNSYQLSSPLRRIFEKVFADYPFDAPFEDLQRDINYVTRLLSEKLLTGQNWEGGRTRLEMIKSVFYRNKGAYLVGRLWIEDDVYPFVLPLLHEDGGIFVDTLLVDANDVSSIFSYNRSYFLVETDIASEMVDFLASIIPTKNLGELYNSIGFIKHGKTVLYRDLLRHLQRSEDPFIVAPGIKGMVMTVFTLPTYNMVFKIIKDHFAPPKQVTEREVREKYELVSLHDRVGRMADSHEFENLVFPRERFSEELIVELLETVPSKVRITEDTVTIRHLYVEKKMIPLNLYLENCTLKEAELAIEEYGNAIKQMAAANIFPGDMLLKNFGVTRLHRVVFYDYDEIGFLTDYNFRLIPEPETHEQEMASEPWYSVGPNDVFPEEFVRFLIGRRDIRNLFFKLHGDLFNVRFWRSMQERLRQGEIIDPFPYRRRLRFKALYGQEQLSGEEGLYH